MRKFHSATLPDEIFYERIAVLSPLRRLILGIAISAVGNGLVLPFMMVYLHTIRGYSISTAGLFMAFMGLSSILTSPFMGSAIDRIGARPVMLLGMLGSALGYGALTYAVEPPLILLCLFVAASSGSALWPAQNAMLAFMSPDRERTFGMQFAFLNLGIGIGGIIAALTIGTPTENSFHLLYVGDALTFLLNLVIAWNIRVPKNPDGSEKHSIKSEGSWKDVLTDRIALRVWVFALIAVLFGYSQLEAGFTSFSAFVAKVPTRDLALAYTGNTLLIAIFQMKFVSWVRPMKRSHALALATSLWAISWIITGSAKFWPSIWILIFAQMIFAIGEMVWSPIQPTLINSLAPDHLRGRYNSFFGATWQTGLILGPVIAGSLLGHGTGTSWILVVTGGSMFATLLALMLVRVLPPKINSGTIAE